jgi:hypothetical protein
MGQQRGQKGPVCFGIETKKDGYCRINCARNKIPNLRVVGSSPIARAKVWDWIIESPQGFLFWFLFG